MSSNSFLLTALRCVQIIVDQLLLIVGLLHRAPTYVAHIAELAILLYNNAARVNALEVPHLQTRKRTLHNGQGGKEVLHQLTSVYDFKIAEIRKVLELWMHSLDVQEPGDLTHR